MWPFGKSNNSRIQDAATIAFQFSKGAFDMYVPDGLLKKGAVTNYYVMGYVWRRLILSAALGCRTVGVSDKYADAITEKLLHEFFDDSTIELVAKRMRDTPIESAEGKDIGRGFDDATRICNYWIEHMDVKTDANYAAAVSLARQLSDNSGSMPTHAEILGCLESMTFGRYFGDKVGMPSMAALQGAIRRR